MSLDPQSLVGKVVRIKDCVLAEIWREFASYHRPGMMARVTGAKLFDDMLQLDVDYSEFEARNMPLEVASVPNADGKLITHREAGEYEAKTLICLDEAQYAEQCDFLDEPEAVAQSGLFDAYMIEAHHHPSYLAFLESHLARAVEAGYEIVAPKAPAPSV